MDISKIKFNCKPFTTLVLANIEPEIKIIDRLKGLLNLRKLIHLYMDKQGSYSEFQYKICPKIIVSIATNGPFIKTRNQVKKFALQNRINIYEIGYKTGLIFGVISHLASSLGHVVSDVLLVSDKLSDEASYSLLVDYNINAIQQPVFFWGTSQDVWQPHLIFLKISHLYSGDILNRDLDLYHVKRESCLFSGVKYRVFDNKRNRKFTKKFQFKLYNRKGNDLQDPFSWEHLVNSILFQCQHQNIEVGWGVC